MKLNEIKDTNTIKYYYNSGEKYEPSKNDDYYFVYLVKGDAESFDTKNAELKFVNKDDFDTFEDFTESIGEDYWIQEVSKESHGENISSIVAINPNQDFYSDGEVQNIEGTALIFSDNILDDSLLNSIIIEMEKFYTDFINDSINASRDGEDEQRNPYSSRGLKQSDFL